LGFWHTATDNHELCEDLFADMEKRGLKLTKRIISVTDGGKELIKALMDKFGKEPLHQINPFELPLNVSIFSALTK